MAVRSLTYSSGYTLKTVVRDVSTGSLRVWNTGTSAFEAYNAANIASYGIATTEPNATGRYVWTIPAALPASAAGSPYDWTTYRIAGTNLAVSDFPNDVNIDNLFEWDGTNFVTTGRVPAAVLAASTGGTAGTVGGDLAAVKAKTANLPASPAAVSDIPTANQNADALLDRANAVETGMTPRNALQLLTAAGAGLLSGAEGPEVAIRNAVADSKVRITATVDAYGNRTAVTYDLT